jgi:hypothetical protein
MPENVARFVCVEERLWWWSGEVNQFRIAVLTAAAF